MFIATAAHRISGSAIQGKGTTLNGAMFNLLSELSLQCQPFPRAVSVWNLQTSEVSTCKVGEWVDTVDDIQTSDIKIAA